MDLENLKNIWDEEQVSETPEISLEKQKEIRMPLEKIRKNMRMEFWSNVIAMIALIPLSHVFSANPFIRWSFYLVLVFIFVYYYIKFYKLYVKLFTSDFSTFHQLMEIKYELKLNIELYKSFYIAAVPFFFAMLLLLLEKHNFFKYDDLIMHYAPFIIFLAVVAFTLGFGKWWWDHFYDKYIRQIEKIMSQLK